MDMNVACRFSRRNADGEDWDARVRDVWSAGDEIGAWKISAGACSRTDARGHCTESCAISSQSSKVRDEVLKSDEGIRRSAFGSSEPEEHGVSWRRNTGDTFFGGSKSGGGESVSARSRQAESYFDSYQQQNVLGYETSGKQLGKSVGALGGLADSRVSASCMVDDCASEGFTQNAMDSGAHADFGTNTFSRLDERASEVLRKSMQALERSYFMKSGSCMSAGPELTSRCALNVCEQGIVVPLRRGELTESSGDPNLRTGMRDPRDLISNCIEGLRKVHVPRKLGGAFSDNRCSYDTMKQLSGDYFIGSREDQSYSGVEANLMDYGSDENEEGSPRRICKWARLPAKNLTTKRNSIYSQIPSHLREDLTISNSAQGSGIHRKGYDIPKTTEEEDYDTRLRHRTLNKAAIPREKCRCHPKPPGVASSLQGVSVAPSSGADIIQHEPTVEEGQDTLDTSGESVKRTEACALAAKNQERENVINPEDRNANGTEVQHQTLHEEKKLANVKLQRSVTVEEHLQDEVAATYLGRCAEGDGCIQTRPSMPSRIHEARNLSARSDITWADKGNFHPKTKYLSAISSTRRPWETAVDALRSAHRPKPLVSPRKIFPIIIISPPRVKLGAQGSYRRAAKGPKSHSEDRKRESPRTVEVEGLAEMIRQRNSPKAPPHNAATTIAVNISVTPTERSGETNQITIRVHSSDKSAESQSTQTAKRFEMVHNVAKSSRQLLAKSTQTVELSIQKPLKIRFWPFNEVSTILKESSDQCSKARTSSISDTSPSSSELQRGSAGLRHWPDVIPELDNWISEVVSGWLGTEDGLLRNVPENTLVKVSSRGTASVVNVSKHENHVTSLKLSSLHGHKTPPSLRLTKVDKLLDIQMKRLADIDSKVSKAHSVDDLFRILEGVSTMRSKAQESLRR